MLIRSVQSLSRVWLFVTPSTTARQASLSINNSPSSPKPMSTESVMPSNHLILCCPLLLPPSILPSIRVFSNESALPIRWPNIGVAASTSVLSMNTQDWSPLGWTGWISLQSRYFKPVTKNKHVPKSNQHHSLKMVGMKYGFLETRAGRYLGKGIREASETFPIL